MDSHEDKLKAPSVLDVDLQKLLGFERVDAKQMDAVKPEDAAAVAFNKRGEGVPVTDGRSRMCGRRVRRTAVCSSTLSALSATTASSAA